MRYIAIYQGSTLYRGSLQVKKFTELNFCEVASGGSEDNWFVVFLLGTKEEILRELEKNSQVDMRVVGATKWPE